MNSSNAPTSSSDDDIQPICFVNKSTNETHFFAKDGRVHSTMKETWERMTTAERKLYVAQKKGEIPVAAATDFNALHNLPSTSNTANLLYPTKPYGELHAENLMLQRCNKQLEVESEDVRDEMVRLRRENAESKKESKELKGTVVQLETKVQELQEKEKILKIQKDQHIIYLSNQYEEDLKRKNEECEKLERNFEKKLNTPKYDWIRKYEEESRRLRDERSCREKLEKELEALKKTVGKETRNVKGDKDQQTETNTVSSDPGHRSKDQEAVSSLSSETREFSELAQVSHFCSSSTNQESESSACTTPGFLHDRLDSNPGPSERPNLACASAGHDSNWDQTMSNIARKLNCSQREDTDAVSNRSAITSMELSQVTASTSSPVWNQQSESSACTTPEAPIDRSSFNKEPSNGSSSLRVDPALEAARRDEENMKKWYDATRHVLYNCGLYKKEKFVNRECLFDPYGSRDMPKIVKGLPMGYKALFDEYQAKLSKNNETHEFNEEDKKEFTKLYQQLRTQRKKQIENGWIALEHGEPEKPKKLKEPKEPNASKKRKFAGTEGAENQKRTKPSGEGIGFIE